MKVFVLAEAGAGGGTHPLWWAVMGLIIVLVLIMRQRRRDRALMDGYTRASLREDREEKEARQVGRDSRNIAAEAADKMLVSFHEISRELIARLDTKARTVEHILDDVDRKLRELELTKRELEGLLVKAGKLDAAEVSGPPEPGPDPGARPEPEPGAEPKPEPKSDPGDARVYALADQGRNVEEIEQATGIPKGEVKLILNMRGAPEPDWNPKLPVPEKESKAQDGEDPEVSHQEMNDILGR